MAVTVGTDVYDTEANVDTYWSNRGNTAWAALSSPNKEIYMRKATDWLDRNFRWRGTAQAAPTSQRLGWPRDTAYDDDGYQIGETLANMPWQVEEAMAIVAELYSLGTYDLEGIVTDDLSSVKFQKVDVIEVEYDTRKRLQGQDVISHVYQLLRPVTFQDKLLRA
jgi:hypothetical protein